jgi:hypothetical protein
MKSTHCFFACVIVGVMSIGQSIAGEPSKLPAKHEAGEVHKTGDHSNNRDQTARSHSLLNNNVPAPERSTQPSLLHTQTKGALGNELHQPGSKKPGTPATSGLPMNKMENRHNQAVKLPAAGGTASLGPAMSRSRSRTTAELGGLTISKARNSTAALDGSTMKRKP